MIFVGIDWAEHHHDVCVLDPDGQQLAAARLPQGVEGVGRLHAWWASTPRSRPRSSWGSRPTGAAGRCPAGGRLPGVRGQPPGRQPLPGTPYHLPGQVRPGDAKLLADLVRTDRHHHRQVAGDSPQAEAVKVLARAHQTLIWTRQRQANQLRSALREFYPGALTAFGAELANPQALAVLAAAPTPAQGRQLTQAQLARLLGRAGRRRNLHRRAAELQQALASPSWPPRPRSRPPTARSWPPPWPS